MEYLYPKFNKTTHKIKNTIGIVRDYPINNSFSSKVDYALPIGTDICVVEENVGFECTWSKIKTINLPLEVEYVYVLNSSLENVGGKKTFEPICDAANEPKLNAPEIDPKLKEIFLPYVDTRNGLFSVRVQTDYLKVLDTYTFDTLLQDVLYEGINILLASRGFRSDNATISNLISDYYTFAYINKDLDLTVERVCEPLTFTVSIPLRFFNNFQTSEQETVNFDQVAKKIIEIRSGNRNDPLNIVNITNRLLRALSSRAGDVQELVFPDKFIENFILDFELQSLKNFAVTFNKLFTIAGFAPATSGLINYFIGFDNSFNLVSIKVERILPNGSLETKILNQSLLSQFRLDSTFNSKRIFNYIENLNNIQQDVSIGILDFLDRYVNYPKAKLNTQKFSITENVTLPPETVKRYRQRHEDAKSKVLRASDVAGAVTSGIEFSDTIYSLFLEKETSKRFENSYAGYKKNFGIIESSWDNENVNLQPFQDKEIGVQFSEGAKNAGLALAEKYSSLNTYAYILRRLNIKKILMQHIFCYIKGINPQGNSAAAAEISSIIASLPEDVISYFNYLQSIKNLKGLSYARAVAAGLPVTDFTLSNSNASLVYFVKAFASIAKAFNVVGTNLINVVTTLDNGKRTKNPFKAAAEQTILAIEQAILNELLNIGREALATSCEDDLLNNQNNTQNPYQTHQPVRGFQQPINSEPARINKNRGNALDDTFVELEFGVDRQYVVDLLDYLLTDINCILTPIESVSLLKGRPTELTITLVKNIIKSKYSAAPNDLSFMLTDSNKLQDFFRRLGQSVDQTTLAEIEKTIIESNIISKTDICNPQYEKVREEILNNKVPPELGILESQLRNRSKKARKLFEYIQNGETTIEISPLCPDLPSEGIEELKDNLVQNYDRLINDIFTPVLENFNSDVANLQTKFAIKGNYYRKDTSGNLIDIVSYDTYYGDLYLNLYLQNNLSIISNKLKNSPDSVVANEAQINYTIAGATDQIQEAAAASFAFTAPPSLVFCPPNQQQINNIEDFFNRGDNLYIEFVREDYFFDGGKWSGTDLHDSRKSNSYLGEELKSRPYSLCITADAEAGSDDFVNFKFIYNNKKDNKYEHADLTFEGTFKNTTLTTEQFYDQLYPFITDNKNPDLQQDDIENEWEKLEIAISAAGVAGAGAAGAAIALTSAGLGASAGLGLGTFLTFIASNPVGWVVGTATLLVAGITGLTYFLTKPLVYRINKNNWYAISPEIRNVLTIIFNEFWLPNIKNAEKRVELERRTAILTGNPIFKKNIKFDFETGINSDKVSLLSGLDNQQIASYKDYLNINTKINKNILKDAFKMLDYSRIFSNALTDKESNSLFSFANEYYTPEKYFYELIYSIQNTIANKTSENYYLKSTFDRARDFIFYEKEPANRNVIYTPQNETEFNAALKSSKYSMTVNNSNTIYKQKYGVLELFYLKQGIKEKACNILLHYLNLDFYKKSALNELGDKICDNNLDIGIDKAITEILVNLTIRTYVTDIMIKAIPFLSLLDKEELINLYKNEQIIDSLLEIITKDQQDIAPQTINYSNSSGANITENKYNKTFKKYVNEVYDEYINNGIAYGRSDGRSRIIKRFNDDLDCSDEYYKYKYFIKKEIYHFVNFILLKEILKPSEESVWKSFIKNNEIPYKQIKDIDLNAIQQSFGSSKVLRETNFWNFYGSFDKSLISVPFFVNPKNYFFNVINSVKEQFAKEKQISSKNYNEFEIEDEELLKEKFEKIYGFPSISKSKITGATNFTLFVDNNVKQLIKSLFYSYFTYFVTCNNVDIFKRSMFFTTKYQLYNILAQAELTKNSVEGQETDYKSQDDALNEQAKITAFLDSLSRSPAPYAVAILQPRYLKNAMEYLKAATDTTRLIVGTAAKSGDFNINLADKINQVITIVSLTTWSLFNEETRRNLIYQSPSLEESYFYKRLEDGRSPVPGSIQVASLGVWLGTLIPPTPIGFTYLAVDALDETLYSIESIAKLREERGLVSPEEVIDPCSPQVQNATLKTITYECTPENKIELIQTFNNTYETVVSSDNDLITKDKC